MIGTIAAWRIWATARGDNAPTAADDTVATAALTRASDYIMFSYVGCFYAGYDETSPNVEEATYVAAGLELATPGFFSSTYTPSQQKVLTEVRGIKWTPVGDASGPDSAAPVSSLINSMLKNYFPSEDLVPYLCNLSGVTDG